MCICVVQYLNNNSKDQGRNFREAMKAMAVVAPQFGLVPLQKMACTEATVVLMPQVTCHIDANQSYCRLGVPGGLAD